MNFASIDQPQTTSSPDISFRLAQLTDVNAIVALVNSAYRGESSRKGWTTEADLLDGQRTDREEISRLIEREGSVILLCMHGKEIVGSVHLEKIDATSAYIGMLVIKPTLQGQGLGKLVMAKAEEFTQTEWDAAQIKMQVITLRHELIAYYRRRGYQGTGEIRPFPASEPKFGIPRIKGLMFEVLEKKLYGTHSNV